MDGHFSLVTAPTVEPVEVLEVQEQARVDGEEGYLAALIKTARRHVERVTGRALVTQTWDYALDRFPPGPFIEIPKPPLQSVGSITYYDEDLSTSTVFASSKYQVDTIPTPPKVGLKSGESWPSDFLRPSSGVVIRFDAGYGDAASDVPEDLRHAIKVLAGDMYENRESEVTGTVVARLGFTWRSLIAPYEVFAF